MINKAPIEALVISMYILSIYGMALASLLGLI